jgi:hypothetical protein
LLLLLLLLLVLYVGVVVIVVVVAVVGQHRPTKITTTYDNNCDNNCAIWIRTPCDHLSEYCGVWNECGRIMGVCAQY